MEGSHRVWGLYSPFLKLCTFDCSRFLFPALVSCVRNCSAQRKLAFMVKRLTFSNASYNNKTANKNVYQYKFTETYHFITPTPITITGHYSHYWRLTSTYWRFGFFMTRNIMSEFQPWLIPRLTSVHNDAFLFELHSVWGVSFFKYLMFLERIVSIAYHQGKKKKGTRTWSYCFEREYLSGRVFLHLVFYQNFALLIGIFSAWG